MPGSRRSLPASALEREYSVKNHTIVFIKSPFARRFAAAAEDGYDPHPFCRESISFLICAAHSGGTGDQYELSRGGMEDLNERL